MGVYIKGMEMPKNCIDCAFGWNGWCHRINSRAFVEVDIRRHDCPLIELPPHGDLIDYDFCMENYELLHDDGGNPVYAVRMRDINNAPTIIPAEGGGRDMRFPKDCWDKNCEHFHVTDMSVDDLLCACDLIGYECDACDEDYCHLRCPLAEKAEEGE